MPRRTLIGGIAMGGVGKTPICNWLAGQYKDAFVLGRGYRRAKKWAISEDRIRAGDEMEMLKHHGRKVVSCPGSSASS